MRTMIMMATMMVVAAPTLAAEVLHNGASVTLNVRGDEVLITSSAVPLFRGEVTPDGSVVGVVQDPVPGCGPYTAVGRLVNETTLVLEGEMPAGCQGSTQPRKVALTFQGDPKEMRALWRDPSKLPLPGEIRVDKN